MYANSAKSVINATLLDENEEWNRVQVNFAAMLEQEAKVGKVLLVPEQQRGRANSA
jgi:hypothetical protein